MDKRLLDSIERGLNHNSWEVRLSAIKACVGRKVPMDIIIRGLNDRDCDVRAIALKAYLINTKLESEHLT